MSKLDPIKPYADLIKLAIFVAVCVFFFWIGGVRQERNCLKDQSGALAEAIKERNEAEGKLAKALTKKPETAKKVSDAVTANPTSPECRVPDAVRDGLQDGIDAGKTATR